jgi:hypothetical protein
MDAGIGRLHCVYSSRSTAFCDTENVLLYNVGISSFARLAVVGVLFERSYEPPSIPAELSGPAEHHHLYVVGAAGGFISWRVDSVVASFRRRTPDRLDKASDWWWSTRSSSAMISGGDLSGERFGLRVRLGPMSRAMIGILKPMLDGIIAAFHSDASPDSVAVDRLAAHLGQRRDAIDSHLNSEESLLGPRRLIWAFRNGLQWNPADDLCVACSVELDERLAPNTFEGDVLKLSHTRILPPAF